MTELYSVVWIIGPVGCTGSDFWFNLNSYPPGSGVFPTSPCTIVGFRNWWVNCSNPNAYLMVGHSGVNGDSLANYTYGNDPRPAITWYPAGTGFAFNPAIDQLHPHYSCNSGDNATMGIQMFYTVP